jgi:hypothetical protein
MLCGLETSERGKEQTPPSLGREGRAFALHRDPIAGYTRRRDAARSVLECAAPAALSPPREDPKRRRGGALQSALRLKIEPLRMHLTIRWSVSNSTFFAPLVSRSMKFL